MRYTWANTILLVLIASQILTGFFGLISGSADFSWVLWLHGVGGYAVGVILFWKSAVIIDALKRRRFTIATAGFLVMAVLVLTILATGVFWTHFGFTKVGGFTLLTVHGLLTIVLAALMIWHVFARRFIFRVPKARNRRAFLRLTGTAFGGLAAWGVVEQIRMRAKLPGATRRFTGSYETGSLSGIFPQVSWLFDFPRPINRDTWQLTVTGSVAQPFTLAYDELVNLPQETLTETLDCTGGWYSTQVWDGIKLGNILEMAGLSDDAQSVTIEAVSGYKRRFPIAEAKDFLLAISVAGAPLTHGHGAPLRLVAPNRRGVEWVKWITHIRVNTDSHLKQLPLPLQ